MIKFKKYLLIILLCIENLNAIEINVTKESNVYNNRSDALIIGVGDYKNKIPKLYGVTRFDIKKIEDFLSYFNVTNTTKLLNKEATLSSIRNAFNKYITSDKNNINNTFIFYYSGHGVQVKDMNNDESDGKDEGTATYELNVKNGVITEGLLLDDELYTLLSKIQSKKILIFDKCHSDSSHRGFNPYIKAFQGDYTFDSSLLKNINIKKKSKTMLTNYIVFSATEADEEAEDSPIGGLFTNSIVDGIVYKKADINNNGIITVGELEKFCKQNISDLANNIRKTYINTNEIQGKFNPIFRPKNIHEQDINYIFNVKEKDKKLINLKTPNKYLLEDTLDNLTSNDIISISLLNNKKNFQYKDRINFELSSIKNGYLNIFIAYQDSYKLFLQNEKIEANKLYVFPQDFMKDKHLIAQKPYGITKIYALLSRNPITLENYLLKNENDLKLTNYIRKSLKVAISYQNNEIIKSEADILTISKIEFMVLNSL